MLNQTLISLVIAAHLLGLTLPQLLEEGVYVVPTLLTQSAAALPTDFTTAPEEAAPTELNLWEMRILPAVADSAARQQAFTAPVFKRFLPLSADRPQPPLKIGTSHGPQLTAASALLMDASTGMVLWQKNPDTVRSVASITKLMTALVYLDHQPADGMDHVHTLAPEENAVVGYNLTLPTGTQVTTGSLFAAMLVGSLNNAALALNGATGLSKPEFMTEMNQLAQELGMTHTQFVDQTGVHDGDQSTVGDIALLAKRAFIHPEISQYAQTTNLEIRDVSGQALRTVRTTDHLLNSNPDLEIQGAKTGTTTKAGYCFVFQVVIEGHSVIGVILGGTSDANRFTDAETMIDWTSQQFDWK